MGSGIRDEASPKRVRAMLGGEVVADSTQVRLVWEKPSYPTYYFPAEDVNTEMLVGTGATDSSERGHADVYSVKVGDRTAEAAALWYVESPVEGLRGMIRLGWQAMDAWIEENEEVYVHPRDPYTRVDVLQSDRQVRVEVDGVTVAKTHQPRLLFETGLPTRYYVPKTDARMDLLTPTEHRSECPYKGTAEYYSLGVNGTTYENEVWWYRHPAAEAAKIAGYVCFYNERVDLYVDGELQRRPESPFS